MQVSGKDRNKKIILFLVVVIFAVAYFSPSVDFLLNSADEGYLLYNFERCARGELPHRDFYDVYGALTYFLGGLLFKVFGVKLLVIRVSVIVLMAIMASLIFLIGCKVAPPLFAALGSALFVIFWGNPLFPLVLYANHCAHCLALVGILCMAAYLNDGNKRWVLAAGICGGLGILFNLLIGVFTLIALGLFLGLKEQFPILQGSHDEAPANENASLPRILRTCKSLLGIAMAAVFALYFIRFRLDVPYFVIFLLPFFLFLGWMVVGEISASKASGSDESFARWAGLKGFVLEGILLGVGPVILLLLQALFYYLAGGLDEMFYDTFVLPWSIDYYLAFDSAELHTALIAVACALVALAVWLGGHLTGKSALAKSIFFAAVLAALVAPTVYVFAYNVVDMVWNIRVSHVLPTASLLVAFPILIKLKQDSPEEARHKLFLSLCYVSSCLFSITAIPRSDLSHVVHACTVIFVVVALLLRRLDEGGKHIFGEAALARRATWGVAAFMLIGLSFLWNLRAHSTWKTFEITYPRARGQRVHHTQDYVNLIETIDFIRDNALPDERIFVAGERQAIYFLSERDTPLMKENYFTYLSSVALIDADSDVRLKDERIIEGLRGLSPRFVIQERDDKETRSFLATWPMTASYLRAAYSPVARFGRFEILQPRVPYNDTKP